MRPVGNATPSELAKYQAAYADKTDEKVIYLTFDAGYENGNLPAILDALKNHQAVGTFFVVGNFLKPVRTYQTHGSGRSHRRQPHLSSSGYV